MKNQDWYKELKKCEVSLQGKLTRELVKLLGKENCEGIIIRGNWDTTYVDDKKTGITLLGISSVRDEKLEFIDLYYRLGFLKQVPGIIEENKKQVLDLFIKYKSQYDLVQSDIFSRLN